MENTVVKTVSVTDAVSIVVWYDKKRTELEALAVTTRLLLKRNVKKLRDVASDFFELRQELEDEIVKKYSSDNKSETTEVEDENGVKQPGRKVKDEFLEAYQAEWKKMEERLLEASKTEEEVELYTIDLMKEAARMDELSLTVSEDTLEMLEFFEGDAHE